MSSWTQEKRQLATELHELSQSVRVTRMAECEAELNALHTELASQVETARGLRERLKNAGISHAALPVHARTSRPVSVLPGALLHEACTLAGAAQLAVRQAPN